MPDPIVNVRHAAPAWQVPRRHRHASVIPVVVETPVRVAEVSPSAMRLAYAGDRDDGRSDGREDVRAPLWEAEGRLWHAATGFDREGARRPVGLGWLTGEGGDAHLEGSDLDLFAAGTTLSRRALRSRSEDGQARVVEVHVAEARAALVDLVGRDLRLCDGKLHHAFDGIHYGLRAQDHWIRPRRVNRPRATAYPRMFRGDGEWYVVRADRTGMLEAMAGIVGMTEGSGHLSPREVAAKTRLVGDRPGVDDVLAMVNAMPGRLVDLLRRGGVDRETISPNMRDLDLMPLRRPMALGSLGLVDARAAPAVAAATEAVVEAALACRPGKRIGTELRNARAYLSLVAGPVLAALREGGAEDAMALEGMAA